MSNISLQYYKANSLIKYLVVLVVFLTASSTFLGKWLDVYNLDFIKIPSIPVILILIIIILDKYLCKSTYLWGWLMKVPFVGGQYSGEIKFAYELNGQLIKDTKKCEMKVSQTCSMIKIDCIFYYENRTDEQKTYSESFAEYLELREGRIKLFFAYRNSGIVINNEVPEALGYNELTYDKENKSFRGIYFSQRNESKGGTITVKKT